MARRAALLAVLPSLCSAFSYVHAASTHDADFLDAVAEDELMPEVMQGLQGDSCQTAEQGTPCWRDVTWLQTTGFKKHPEWYPGYSSKSSFEDVQLLLYRNGKVHCPKPCLANVLGADHEAKPEHVLLSSSCMDAVEGDLCFRTVRWLKRTGLEQHPDWFPALEASDSTVTIQAELHRQGKSQCRRPCARSSPAGDDDVTTTGESPPYQALGAQKAGLRVRVGSGDAASWVWDFPKEEVVPTTAAGKTLMQCLRKLLHVTPENFNDMRALCEALVPLDGEVQHHALVKESMKFITWAQHHVDELRAKRREQDEQLEISDPAARPELREGDCLTAQPNTVCYTAVSYGLSEGIRKHPLVYEGLSEHASFEKVQEFLWLNKRHGCTKPCPRKRARDITEFYKHPEALRYKKRAADMSIDEMSRYISGEWDGYVSRMFDADADDLGTLNQHAPASTAKPAVGAASREDRAIAEPVDQAVQTKIAEVAANDTGEGMAEDPEPEKSASDEDVANASTENGFTPIFSDVVSINMSDVSEGVANVTPIFSDVVSINMSDVSEGVANVSEREASVSEPDSDPISQREKDLAEREKAIAEREKAIADLEKTLSALGSEKALATLDAVAVAPKEPVADTPTKAVADAPTEEDSTAAQPISTVAVANAPLEPVADAPTQADATAAEPTSNDAVANAPLEPVADAPTQADATAAEPTSNDAGANALPEPVAETPTQADSTAAEPTSNDAVADALPEPVADTPTQADSTAAEPTSNDAVASVPPEPVADTPTQADSTAAEPTSNDAVANALPEPVADTPTQADSTAAEPTSNDAVANALPEPVADAPTQADSTAAEPTSNDAVTDALPEPVADAPTEMDSTAVQPISNDAVASAPPEPVVDTPTQADSTAAEPTSNDAVANALPEPVVDAPAEPVADAPSQMDAVFVDPLPLVPTPEKTPAAPQQEGQADPTAGEPQPEPRAQPTDTDTVEEEMKKMFQNEVTEQKKGETESEMEEQFEKSFLAPTAQHDETTAQAMENMEQ